MNKFWATTAVSFATGCIASIVLSVGNVQQHYWWAFGAVIVGYVGGRVAERVEKNM